MSVFFGVDRRVQMSEEQLKKHRPEEEQDTATSAMSDDPSVFERTHVHEVYSQIAAHFSATRYKAWPKVAEFVQGLPAHSVMVDVGSGNGKNLALAPRIVSIGCDFSRELLALGRARGHESLRCDGLQTAFRSGVADAVISIAVIHHFSTLDRRRAAVAELLRLLRPGGQALIYVWAMEQSKDRGGTDVLIDWEVHQNFDENKSVLKRYYHLFKKGELEELVALTGGCSVSSSYFDKENWVVVVVKDG